MERTHKCADLRICDDKKTVVLVGWAQRIRDHGGKKFIDLRDMEGLSQVVFDPDVTKNFSEVESFRREFLIKIYGVVRPRPDGTINNKLATGEVEILVEKFEVINSCAVLPFDIDEEHFKEVSEEVRMEHRYLDLRRPKMQKIIMRRHKFFKACRNFLDEKGFIECSTPMLTKSTPEGARDFLVPFRKKNGHFFALPQSPQLFKQLLMISGFERYYQFATCFRDEDLRKDRQYEHIQLDMEMSFMSKKNSFKLIEELLVSAFNETFNIKLEKDFKVLSFNEAIDKFGSDKPDLRIKGLELINIGEIVENCGFSVFKSIVERGGLVKGFKVENGQELLSRKDIDKLIKFCQENGAKGMAWMKVIENGKIESSITKFFKEDELDAISNKFDGKKGDLLFFIADTKNLTNNVLDALRRKVAKDLNMIDSNENKMYFIVDFPLFHWDEGSDKLDFEHNPFTMPLEKEDIDFLMSLKRADVSKNIDRILEMKSDCYDLVFNGVEISSGASRIHLPKLQKKMFDLVDFSEEKIQDSFGWFLKAYDFGAPPHRGFGIGVERILMLVEKVDSIRDVIAFPRNKHGYCPLTNSPSRIDEEQLKDINLKVIGGKKVK